MRYIILIIINNGTYNSGMLMVKILTSYEID